MKKTFLTPSIKIVILNDGDLIVTSEGNRSLGVDTDSDVNNVSKAPDRSIWDE
jgi:hypothetical protein